MKKNLICLYDFLLEEGGLERVMITQAKHLSKKHNVFASFATINEKLNPLFSKRVKILEHSKAPFSSDTLKIIRSFLDRLSLKKYKKAGLFISHSFICTRLAYHMKKKYNIPYVAFLHHPPNFLYFKGNKLEWGFDLGRKVALAAGLTLGPILRAIDRHVVRNADKVFANSHYTKRRIEKIYGVDATVIYPHFEEFFTIKKPKETKYVLEKYNLKKFIVCSGRLIPDKKYDLLVRAFSLLKENDLELVFVGRINRDYEYLLREIAIKLGCMNRIKFLGFVSDEDLVALHNQSQLFAYPSPEEDFGMVPIEAMACGCPVVAWADNAGPSESVIEGVNGYLAKPYDLRDFALQIQRGLKTKFKKQDIAKTVEKFKEEKQMQDFMKELEPFLKN